VRYKLILPPDISRAIGNFGLGRQALLGLLNWLYSELEDHADNYRSNRDSTHPDLYFSCELTVWDQGRPRGCRFTVDDARATGILFLVAVEET
jgi:hypothetical protein